MFSRHVIHLSLTQLAAALHSPSQSSPIGFCTVSTSLPQGYLWVSRLSHSQAGEASLCFWDRQLSHR